MHSHFVSYLRWYSTEEDHIHNETTLHVAYPILGQSHACCCPGNLRSQGINGHQIVQVSRNIPSLASEELKCEISAMCPYVTVRPWEIDIYQYDINIFQILFSIRW